MAMQARRPRRGRRAGPGVGRRASGPPAPRHSDFPVVPAVLPCCFCVSWSLAPGDAVEEPDEVMPLSGCAAEGSFEDEEPDVADEPLPPEVADEPALPDVAEEPALPEVADEPVLPDVLRAPFFLWALFFLPILWVPDVPEEPAAPSIPLVPEVPISSAAYAPPARVRTAAAQAAMYQR